MREESYQLSDLESWRIPVWHAVRSAERSTEVGAHSLPELLIPKTFPWAGSEGFLCMRSPVKHEDEVLNPKEAPQGGKMQSTHPH